MGRSSRKPRRRSARWIALLTAGCEMPRKAAAPVTVPLRITAWNISSWRAFTPAALRYAHILWLYPGHTFSVDPATGVSQTYGIAERDTLSPGDRITGPAVIVERETSTVVTSPFDAVLQSDGAILLVRKGVLS